MDARDSSSSPVGVVLAGGRSRRMGRDKAMAELGETTLLRRAVEVLRPLTAEVVVADAGRELIGETRSIPDATGFTGGGPASGLLGAAEAFPARPLVLLACDMPFIPSGLPRRLFQGLVEGHDLSMPTTSQGLEPAVSAWGPRALGSLADLMASGRRALRGVLGDSALRIELVEIDDSSPWGPLQRLFLNVNRERDLREAERLLRQL